MSVVRKVLSGLDEIATWQEALYVQLHANPELSMQETETRAAVATRLETFGYETQLIGGGVVGVLANGDGPTVLFRADMDALPVQELTNLAYASTKTATDEAGNQVPVMHACGHDMHVAAGLGSAALLAAHRDAWRGDLRRPLPTRRGDRCRGPLDGRRRPDLEGPETGGRPRAARAHRARRR